MNIRSRIMFQCQTLRKKKRKNAKKRMKKVEKSPLGRPIPKEKLPQFKENFQNGKMKSEGSRDLRFLKKMDFPFNDAGSNSGKLRPDFRSIVKKKVINKLPDYCEQTKLEKEQKIKEECSNRAKRIRERITKRRRGKG